MYKRKNITFYTHHRHINTHTYRSLASDEAVSYLEADDAQNHERRQEGVEQEEV